MSPHPTPIEPLVDADWAGSVLALTEEFGRVAVFERNLRDRTGRWSPHMFRMFGLPIGERAPTFDEVLVLLHPDDRPVFESALQHSLAHPGRHEARLRVLTPAGQERHLHSRWEVRCDAQGVPTHVVGAMIDDTEVVTQQQAVLREREQVLALKHRIELVTVAAGVGVWTVDILTDELEWSDEMYRIYGVSPGHKPATLGILTQTLVHPDDRALLIAQRRRAAGPGKGNLHFVLRIVRPDGAVRTISSWSRREISASGRLMAYGVTMDITEQQRAQDRLRSLDESAVLAAQSAGIGAWETDLVSGETSWNSQMYRLRGLPADSTQPVHEIYDATVLPEDLPELKARIAAASESGDGYEHEFRVRWPDASVHWLAVRGVPKRDSAGRITRLIGVTWEVTERKRAEALQHEKAAAEQASRAKSEFLSRMSHELRTPLNAVLGFTQLLQHDGEAGDPQRRAQRLQQIASAGRHLLALIDDVLDIASIESDAFKLDLRPTALQAAFDDAGHWMSEHAAAAHIALHVAPAPGWVRADARRLRQIVANLLSNAIKYNRPLGQVWLQAEPVAGAPDGAPLAWEIIVRDTGRGLDAEQQSHLFEPFNRLGAELGDVPGHGIGLAIVRRLVEGMAGTIVVRSEPGQGSEFRIRLPATAEPAPGAAEVGPSAAATVPAQVPARTLELLYIEDNPVNTLLVEELVALRPGTRLATAIDGREGIARALALRPDAVLVDMQLPDIDGLEVMRRLRDEPTLAGCRFIALSASAMPDTVQGALAAGFHDYWTKPIEFDRFLAGLDALALDVAGAAVHPAPLAPPP